MRSKRRQVVGIVVHVMAGSTLARAAMAAAVMGDDAKAAVEEEQHLRVAVVGRERPAMAEDNRLSQAPILVEDLGAVFRGDRRHKAISQGSTSCMDHVKAWQVLWMHADILY